MANHISYETERVGIHGAPEMREMALRFREAMNERYFGAGRMTLKDAISVLVARGFRDWERSTQRSERWLR